MVLFNAQEYMMLFKKGPFLKANSNPHPKLVFCKTNTRTHENHLSNVRSEQRNMLEHKLFTGLLEESCPCSG